MMAPFDAQKLDRLMDEAGIDLLLATSRHNVQYLLGGYRFFFFNNLDAIGLGRYLPTFVYARGRQDDAFYVGSAMEGWQEEVTPVWVRRHQSTSWSCADAARAAAGYIKQLGLERGAIAIEGSYMPDDAMRVLREELPGARFGEAFSVLEELRAVKSPRELALLRQVAVGIVDAMLTTMQGATPGVTEQELAEQVRREVTVRGLVFEHCLVNAGDKFGRAPSTRPWRAGEVLCLDSAGHIEGYLGDMARMAVLGEPTAEMQELLGEVTAVQAAAREPIVEGRPGQVIYDAALAVARGCPHWEQMDFLAHGMGMIPHEAPHLTATGPIPYPATHKDRPLEAGMVLSIETQIRQPRLGFIKLEDTVVVTETGWEALGDWGRGWNVVGG
jgi:Xaa-Pro aminopeptidase